MNSTVLPNALPAASQPPNGHSLKTLEQGFGDQAERTVGVELELFIVDAKTGKPLPIFHEVHRCLPPDVQMQVVEEHLKCQVEIVSSPHRSLRSLRDELSHLVGSVEHVLTRFNAKLLWSGTHPDLVYDDAIVIENVRTIHNRRRFGELMSQLQTCGVHFHVGVARDEAIRVIDGMQDYLPMLVALAANSPLLSGAKSGRRSQRAAIWSTGFPVCGLSGPFGTWDAFNHRVAKLAYAGRIETPKDLYDFVRPTRFSTVEVRCCDLPCSLDQVISLAAVMQALVHHLASQDDVRPRDRDILRAELYDAMRRGPEARLTDLQDHGVSPLQMLTGLVNELEPYALELGTDVALRMAPWVLADNGSTHQLQQWDLRQASHRERGSQVRGRFSESSDRRWATSRLATAASMLIGLGFFAWGMVAG